MYNFVNGPFSLRECIKSILFKGNLENSSSHKNFLNWAAYLHAGGTQICGGPIDEIFVARWIFQVTLK